MKNIKRQSAVAIIIAIAISVSLFAPLTAEAATVDGKTISSAGAAVIDFETGIMLFGHNERDRRAPASTLKIVAALIVYDAVKAGEISLDSTTRISAGVSAFSRNREFSNIRLAEGASLSIQRLLEFVIVSSACAATVALAEALCGDEDTFVRRMNAKATALDIRASFVDCWGGSPDNQISPLGMAIMARYLIKDHPEVLTIASKRSVTYNGTTYSTTNALLGQYTGLDGLKTGFTTPAGYCFIGTALKGERRIIAVTFGSTQSSRFQDTRILLDYGFAVADSVIAEQLGKDDNGFSGNDNNGDDGVGDGNSTDIGALANTSSANLVLNGFEMPLTAYLINDAHYFKLRDVAFLLSGTGKGFGVESWISQTNTAILSSGMDYDAIGGELSELSDSRPYMLTNSRIFFDGVECSSEIYLIDGNNYFKLRDLAILMDFFVLWIGETRTVIIETGKSYGEDDDGEGPDGPVETEEQEPIKPGENAPDSQESVDFTIAVTYLNRPTSDFTAAVGEKIPLRARLEPAVDLNGMAIIWSSSNSNVFTVATNNAEGTSATVTITGAGNARLTVTCGNAIYEVIVRSRG